MYLVLEYEKLDHVPGSRKENEVAMDFFRTRHDGYRAAEVTRATPRFGEKGRGEARYTLRCTTKLPETCRPQNSQFVETDRKTTVSARSVVRAGLIHLESATTD